MIVQQNRQGPSWDRVFLAGSANSGLAQRLTGHLRESQQGAEVALQEVLEAEGEQQGERGEGEGPGVRAGEAQARVGEDERRVTQHMDEARRYDDACTRFDNVTPADSEPEYALDGRCSMVLTVSCTTLMQACVGIGMQRCGAATQRLRLRTRRWCT